jgi:hypothetical protein
MLWFIQNILFSISLIVIIHYLYIYFETTLTAPKVKDLIHCPKQKYKSLFDTINKNLDNAKSVPAQSAHLGIHTYDTSIHTYDTSDIIPSSTSSSSSIPSDMKTDLKTFLRGIGLKSKSSSDNFRPSYEMS